MTMICVKQIVAAHLEMFHISPENPLPNNYRNKRQAEAMGTWSISGNSIEFIKDEICRRKLLDHVKEIEENEAEDSENGDDESNDESDDVSNNESNDESDLPSESWIII